MKIFMVFHDGNGGLAFVKSLFERVAWAKVGWESEITQHNYLIMEKEYIVYGTVTGTQNEQLEAAEVIVWWQRIRDRQKIETGRTTEDGNYYIKYRLPEEASEKVLIVVEAISRHLESPLLSVATNIQPKLKIDLMFQPHDNSEYSLLVKAVNPFLDKLELTDVVENDTYHDITFLAQETGNNKEQIVRLAIAARLHEAYNVSAAVFYAFMRLQIPSSLPSPLLEATDNFTLIDGLVQSIASMIFALTPDLQTSTLQAAVKQNIISTHFTKELTEIVTSLQSNRVTDLLAQPYLVGKTSLGQLLTIAAIPADKQQAFATALTQNTLSMTKFWSTLDDGNHGFTAAEASSIELTLSIGAFVKNYAPVLQLVQQRFSSGTASNLSDLARLSLQDWEGIVNQAGAPPSIDAAGTATSNEVFARVIYARVTRAFPTIALASRIVSGNLVPQSEQASLNQFYLQNGKLDLLRQNFNTYVNQKGTTPFAGISKEDQAGVITNVRMMQRVLLVTPEVDSAYTLLNMGIKSATQIAMMGNQQFFILATNAGITKPIANKIYKVATQRYAGLIALYTQFNRDLNGVTPVAASNIGSLDTTISTAIAQDPTLTTLFGSQDYCEVEDCTSVLSAAAYLCDLLYWLNQRNAVSTTPQKSALDVLKLRRPDIGNLKLNCPNTDTTVPYIDLINEILSDALSDFKTWSASNTQNLADLVLDNNGNFELATVITGPTGGTAPTWNTLQGGLTVDGGITWLNIGLEWKQTSDEKTPADILAAPEYFNPNAFNKLFNANYPHTLPYSEGLDELRAYIQQSGIALWQLRNALLPLHSPTLGQEVAVASEIFTMAPHTVELITTVSFIPNTVAFNNPSPTTQLSSVPVFMQAASITYNQLFELIQYPQGEYPVTWVGGSPGITITGIDDTCNTGIMTLSPTDDATLDRVHRFLRLWRVTVFQMWELDLMMQSHFVANNSLDQNALVALGNFRLLQDMTNLPVDAQLAWFQVMDTNSHIGPNNTTTTPLYTSVYLNPAIVSLHPDSDIATLAVPGGVINDNNLNDHLQAIQAALSLSSSDLNSLVILLGLDAASTLTLGNLSLLFRITQFVAVANISITDFINIATFIQPGTSSFEAAITNIFTSVSNATESLQQIKAIQQAGLSIDALLYLLTPPIDPPPYWLESATAMNDTEITAVLTAVRQAILIPGIPAAWQKNTAYTTGQQIFDGVNIQTCIAAGTSGSTPPASWNTNFGGTTNDGGTLVWTNSEDPISGSVIAAVAKNLNTVKPLSNDITAFLINTVKLNGTTTPLLNVLTAPSITSPAGGPYPDITRVNYPNQFSGIQLLDKIRVIATNFKMVLKDLSWLVSNAAVYGGIDFTQLPVISTQSTLTLEPLLSTVLLVKLARLFTAAPSSSTIQTLYDVMSGVQNGTLANEGATQTALSTVTGWAVADISSFTTALGVIFPADYLLPATFDTLRTLEAMIKATANNASAEQLISWAVVPVTELDAESIASTALNVLKARYSNPDWTTAAPAIMNPLREDRSAALQNYLIGNGDSAGHNFVDVNALFDFFLIDTQMSSCMVTSRVVQAYIAVQVFVERCLMSLETSNSSKWTGIPDVNVDPNDDAWSYWSWMSRYRVWEAAREVFLYPENWLVESQRLNRTEIYKKLEQDVHQNQYTADNFETVLLNYLDGLDGIAHLIVTGTCQDSDGTIYVVSRTQTDPPTFYYRTFQNGEWSGWVSIPLHIKARQVVPAIYSNRLCLFWGEVIMQNEPTQNLPPAQASSNPPSQDVSKYVSMGLYFSTFRNNSWAPAQMTNGKLFDVPLLSSQQVSHSSAVESLYTIKATTSPASGGYGPSLYVEVFRLGDYQVNEESTTISFGFGISFTEESTNINTESTNAVQIGRAIFDGRFSELQQNNLSVLINGQIVSLLAHAQATYGPDALPLLPLDDIDNDLIGEPNLLPRAGALITQLPDAGGPSVQMVPLVFTALADETGSSKLLNTVQLPFRVVGPVSDLNFDPTNYFFFNDNRRSYYVEAQKLYLKGSLWTPVIPSNPASAPFEVDYIFHRFYHPYTRLLWHQLSSLGFPGVYTSELQETPDQIDPTHADVFSFKSTYQPVVPFVKWGEDNEVLDFSTDAAYSVYNWEFFFHSPLYIAGLLSQNQQFDDAMTWFRYIFNPTLPVVGNNAPQAFWVTKPFRDLTSTEIGIERINNLLGLVNSNDPNALNQVNLWMQDPFNPFLLADLRPVAYMKNVVMQYLDNIIAMADNLFATDSREALSEATLLYVMASEILGPQPSAITPPTHADDSYNELAPNLDAFANAMVEIENVMGTSGGGNSGGTGTGIPGPQTFYFKIPPNDKLLGYWDTVADRLYKLRHCQDITGASLQLALFDAPIDPGLLVQAQAAGIDIGSVLSDLLAPLPNYRYTALYTQALDFVNAVRAYGTALQGAIEKSDSDNLALMLATNQQQLLSDADQIFDWQVQQTQNAIDAMQNTIDSANEKYQYYNNLTQLVNFANPAELASVALATTSLVIDVVQAATKAGAAILGIIPSFKVGVSGLGSPVATIEETAHKPASLGAKVIATLAAIAKDGAGMAKTLGDYLNRNRDNNQKATEAQADATKATTQLAGLKLALQIAQQNQINHQNQENQLQMQIDFLTNKFSNQDLYDWMVGKLSDTYFQSYQLAYKLCKQVEKCYQYELGLIDGSYNSFIQFGYWDSLHKGLLAGETINHDLRRMQSSYLDQNKRRFEISRYISLASLSAYDKNDSIINPSTSVLQSLLVNGKCYFDLPETLFDNDYPGHYNRRLTRVSMTVVYPSPGKFDNIKATLTLLSNKVRFNPDSSSSYQEGSGNNDIRFHYNFGAVPQKIVMGNAQDDPGLFVTAIASNIVDQRYLPFEGAGAISSWLLEMPQSNNDIDLSNVGDVILHLYYTALDGGGELQTAVEANNLANLPTSGIKVFSSLNDFPAGAPTVDVPYQLSPWQAFLSKQTAIIGAMPYQEDGLQRWQAFNNPPTPETADAANPGKQKVASSDQVLKLSISASKFPSWTRNKTITINSITVLVVSSAAAATFTLAPQGPLLPGTSITMTPVTGVTGPNVYASTPIIPLSPGIPLTPWQFKIQMAPATDFQSLTKDNIGDVLLLISFNV